MPGLPTVASIERQIVRRLAERAEREPCEFEDELRSADRDLPVDPAELIAILDVLELDFSVRLPCGPVLESRLDYVRELAILIQTQMLESSLLARSG